MPDLPPVGAPRPNRGGDVTGAEMVTWSDPDGGNVAGTDYSFVTGPEWFDDLDEPVAVRRQRWVCVEDETGTWWPSAVVLCDACTGEGELYPPNTNDVAECPACKGAGEHPMRGAGFVAEEASDGWRKARGVAPAGEPSEDVIRRLRDGAS